MNMKIKINCKKLYGIIDILNLFSIKNTNINFKYKNNKFILYIDKQIFPGSTLEIYKHIDITSKNSNIEYFFCIKKNILRYILNSNKNFYLIKEDGTFSLKLKRKSIHLNATLINMYKKTNETISIYKNINICKLLEKIKKIESTISFINENKFSIKNGYHYNRYNISARIIMKIYKILDNNFVDIYFKKYGYFSDKNIITIIDKKQNMKFNFIEN